MFFPRQIFIYDRKTYNISAYKKDRRNLFTMQSNDESLIYIQIKIQPIGSMDIQT